MTVTSNTPKTYIYPQTNWSRIHSIPIYVTFNFSCGNTGKGEQNGVIIIANKNSAREKQRVLIGRRSLEPSSHWLFSLYPISKLTFAVAQLSLNLFISTFY